MARTNPTVNTWDPVENRAVDVPGHWADRDPDMTEDEARTAALRGDFEDVDDDALPLLESDMRTDPIEGTHGSYTHVTRLDEVCPACETSEYGVRDVQTLPHCHVLDCLLCGERLGEVF